MGEFLSTPNKAKASKDEENSKIKYGSCGMQGWRKRMEDAHITDISQGPNQQFEIFGVFDGHGGKEVSQFVKAHFTQELLSNPRFKEGLMTYALKETFLKMDELMRKSEGKEELRHLAKLSKEEDDLQNQQNPNSQTALFNMLLGQDKGKNVDVAMMTGCTACVCLIDHDKKKMYFANAGDSRVVLCKKGIAYAMSVDHKPEMETEKNRIYKAEGWVSEGRIKGNLNLSRSLGDLEYKQNVSLSAEEQMITANPEIVEEDLTEECDFLILGCDGIWDCLSNQEACNFIKKEMELEKEKLSPILEKMMDSILPEDLNKNETGIGCDNMTCILVQFKK